ncbi:2-oxoglutarate dehydrogenase E2 component (dihydrolipoamide succinyltransferase) [Diaminobutyricimonas aerilata]|uniref:Dihydrolipoamide acetyltransferase component of pyruvate dehydrogenase complex n=1 Tax=Diaminobutyricimonas aerilata TaxID=1162967 RepID=A0A2M9CJP6_9MICO|nr:2-oxoglutarate dehydrogenase, E2 component, dihydrolipoamide succinyltransferase [Diaminobutyricimonas aerilata]PJJ72119.1 2-oxoglutarate dehydrogenase E2 component (dihydrolipoamide succinyltransferase) [Diaminobutyricimonas aerilata]
MSESVNLPALGESVTEGTVTRWLKNVGDRVEVDEPLLEVSTDKVDTEIPSPIAGVVEEILVGEDETVEVGTPLVRIGDGSGGGDSSAPGEQAPAAQEAPAAPAQEAPQQEAPQQQQQPAQEAPQQAPAEQTPAPVSAAPAETAPAAAAPATAPSIDAPAAEPQIPQAESTEVPTDGAPAPGEEPQPAEAPAPAPEADQPPAAQDSPAPTGAQPGDEPASQPAPQAEQPAAEPAPQAAPQAEAAPSSDDESGANAGYVTPLVRKLAHEKGIDLASLTGTGVGGRIRKQDVLEAAEKAQPAAAAAEAPATPARQKLEDSPLRGTTVPMSRLRKVVAQRAVQSLQTSAQLTTVVEVDVTKVAALRDRVKASFLEKTGTKLSFLPFFALAAVEALRAYPVINATVDGETIVYPPTENLNIAVDTERGLLTPVIRDASTKDIAGLAREIADLAARTRENKLKPDELAGGTFTLTNTGSRGALFDTPLVFLPQSAILGTGIVSKKPAVVSVDGNDAIAIRSTVYLALSYDHRIVDGADAARFLVAVKNRLEEGDFEGQLGI